MICAKFSTILIGDFRMKVNTILYTKDGRLIGNAIIIEETDKFNVIKTDYGNVCILTDDEIINLFHINISDSDLFLTAETHKYSVKN